MKFKKILSVLFVASMLFQSLIFADDFVPEGEDDAQISANVFTLDADNTGGDINLQFGLTLSEYIKWNDINARFELSDSLDLLGNQLINARVENLVVAPTCDIASRGKMYHDTTDNHTYVCDSVAWMKVDSGGGSIPFLEMSPLYEIAPNETKTISFFGQGFSPGMTVSFPGFAGTIDSTTIIGPTQVDVEITSDAIETAYDVVLESSGGLNTDWTGNGVNKFNVTIPSGVGPSGTYDEGFEGNNLGQWVDSTGLDVLWTVQTGGTPSGNTGPNGPATGTYYVFTEASSPNYPTKTFGIETDYFSVAQSISFDYHMFGADMGTLEVQTFYSGSWTTVDTITGQQQAAQGDSYLNRNIDLTPYSVEKIRLFYTSGSNYTGDCALDNIIIISN